MRRKLILFLMLALFGSSSFLRADELTVHDQSGTNSYVPVYGFYADSYLKCEMVFPAAELADMENGTISGITFYASTPAAEPWTGTFQVFVTEVADATISAFAGPGTVVYEGTLDGTQSSMTITFNEPYAYSGGNLLVGVYCTTTGNYKSVTWAGEAVDGASVQGYSYSALSAVSPTQRNFLPKTTFTYTAGGTGPTPPTPPTPTGNLAITPNPFTLGDRPNNGWMEPYTVKIINNGPETTIEGSVSNTSGESPFALDPEVAATLPTDEAFEFTIEINPDITGDYTEEFTLFYTDERNILTIPVTASIYEAGEADIVETAYNFGNNLVGDFSHTPADLHPNYFGYQGVLVNDAVYKFTLTKDSKFSVTGGEFIGIYKYVTDFHPTTAVEPVVTSVTGTMTEKILLAGTYYMIVAGENIGTVEGTVEQIPAPEALTALAPADGAVDVEAPVTLTWEGGENATQYQVLFGTSPVNMDVVLDWTMVDDNFGSYTIASLASNTQYFWQIKAKNSNGTVETTRRGFTTVLNAPFAVTASEEEIFTDESTLIKWKLAGVGSSFTGEITVADGTETNSYIPVYGLWMDDYTRGEMIYPEEMIEEMTGGEITSMTFYISSSASGPWSGDVFNVYLMPVDATTLSAYYTSANATIVYTGALDGQGTTMTVNFATPYVYEGGNLLVGIEETVCGTYKSCSFYGVTATGASASGYNSSSLSAVTFNQRNFLPKTTFVCGGKGVAVAPDRGFKGFNLYYDDVKVNDELIQEKQYLLENLPYNVVPGHDINVTAVYDEGESGHSAPIVTVKVSGYGTLTGYVTELISGGPIAGATVKIFGKDEFQNDVDYTATTDVNGKYTIEVKAGTYNRGIATFPGMETASLLNPDPVVVSYDGITDGVDFVMHEVYNPVYKVYAQELDPTTAKVIWSLYDFVNPTPNTPGGGGSASTFTEGFESGMPSGWTVVDANNDGYTWCMTSAIPSTWTYYATMTLDWYRSGSNAICSGSYINGVGALNPDEYLVMGQQTLAAGSTLSFWAAATDASYPADHFGVFVSDDMASWTSVQEWTLTGKSGGNNGGRASRDGKGAKLGTWYQYTVDLSAHAGQKYIAIRHFNCYDQYIMCVDDIELSNGSKDRSVENYTVVRKALLKENALTDADSVKLVDHYTDTIYADIHWNDMEPGLYQYGVSAVYPSPAKGRNRDEVIIGEGTGTSGYVPTYNLYNYSCTNQIYTAEEIGGMGTINSIAFMPATVNTASRNLNVYMVNTDKTSFAGGTDWIPVTDADLVYSGTVNWIANTWCTIELTTPFNYDGTNLCVIVNDLTGSWTSSNQYFVSDATAQAIRIYQDSAPYNPAAPGSGTVLNVKNNIKLDITFGGGAGGNDNPETEFTWSNILPKDMETTVTVNALMPVGTPEGATVQLVNTYEGSIHYEAEFDETGTVTFEEFKKGPYKVTVDLEGYTSDVVEQEFNIWEETEINANLTEVCKPVDEVAVSVTGFATWTPVVPLPDRSPEKYFMQLDGVFIGETPDNFFQLNEEELTIGQTYNFGVAVVYSVDMSVYVTTNFTYLGCEGVAQQVENLAVDSTNCVDWNVALVWNGGEVPGVPTPPTPPTPGTGEWYYYDNGNNADAIGTGGGNFWWGVMFPAGSYTGNMVTKTAAYDYMAMTGTVTIYNDGATAPASAVGTANVTLTGSNNFVETEFAQPVVIDPSKNLWIVYYNGSGATYPAAVCANTGDANGRWVSLDGSTWEDLAGYGLDYTFQVRAYVAQGTKGDVVEITAPMGTGSTGTFTNAGVAKCNVETCGTISNTTPSRAQWDLLKDFNGTSGYQYGVATDGTNIYTSSWSASSTSMFYKYDMDGNFVEEFNVSGCGQIRDLTYDGQYFYGVANSSTIYCVDLANHTLVGSTTSAYGAMRCCSYDPVRDGFWVVGNWSGNLTLVDRTGAIQFTGPAPTSASGVAYYKDADNVEHVLCFNNGDNGVYDYNITTNTMGGQVFNYNNAPGTGTGSSGGCHIANYGDKLAFYGDIQASPQYIAIYELGEAQGGGTGGGGSIATELTPGKFNIMRDGEIVAATSDNYYIYQLEQGDVAEHTYTVFYVDNLYGISCEQEVVFAYDVTGVAENNVAAVVYPNPTNGDLHINAENMVRISIVNVLGQMVYDKAVEGNEAIINMAQFGNGVYMVNIATENGTSVKRVIVSK